MFYEFFWWIKILLSNQAYSKKRQNLNPEVFRILNDEYVKMMNDQRNDLKTYGYYYVLAVDGYNGLENSEKAMIKNELLEIKRIMEEKPIYISL